MESELYIIQTVADGTETTVYIVEKNVKGLEGLLIEREGTVYGAHINLWTKKMLVRSSFALLGNDKHCKIYVGKKQITVPAIKPDRTEMVKALVQAYNIYARGQTDS